MPQRRLALNADIVLKILDVESGLCCVLHPPDHHGPDLNGIAPLVVHFQLVAIEVPRAQGDLETRWPLKANARCQPAGGGIPLQFNPSGQSADLARSVRVEGIAPVKPRVAHRPSVGAKQDQDARFIGLQSEEANEQDYAEDLQQYG